MRIHYGMVSLLSVTFSIEGPLPTQRADGVDLMTVPVGGDGHDVSVPGAPSMGIPRLRTEVSYPCHLPSHCGLGERSGTLFHDVLAFDQRLAHVGTHRSGCLGDQTGDASWRSTWAA